MLGFFCFQSLLGLARNYDYASPEAYPVPEGTLQEMTYSPASTAFQLWAPTAQRVELRLYHTATGGRAARKIGRAHV